MFSPQSGISEWWGSSRLAAVWCMLDRLARFCRQCPMIMRHIIETRLICYWFASYFGYCQTAFIRLNICWFPSNIRLITEQHFQLLAPHKKGTYKVGEASRHFIIVPQTMLFCNSMCWRCSIMRLVISFQANHGCMIMELLLNIIFVIGITLIATTVGQTSQLCPLWDLNFLDP